MMQSDFRDAVFLAVGEVMSTDPRAVILYNDMGALELDRLRQRYPTRVYNVGICEQNMASLAAGLALDGRCVFTYGIIAHVFARSFEQIRNDICCENLPVTILGVGSGLSYGADGPTHHGVQDVAVMRTLPNLAIFNPSDYVSAQAAVRMAAARRRPAFIRMDKDQVPALYSENHDFSAGFAVLREGRDAALVTTGVLVHRAVEVADRLLKEGIGIRVVDVFRIKPIAEQQLADVLADVRSVISLEENSPVGGLGSIIGELLARGKSHPYFSSIGLDDNPLIGSASRSWAERRFRYTADEVAASVRVAVRSSTSSR
jgi:transketolase